VIASPHHGRSCTTCKRWGMEKRGSEWQKAGHTSFSRAANFFLKGWFVTTSLPMAEVSVRVGGGLRVVKANKELKGEVGVTRNITPKEKWQDAGGGRLDRRNRWREKRRRDNPIRTTTSLLRSQLPMGLDPAPSPKGSRLRPLPPEALPVPPGGPCRSRPPRRQPLLLRAP